MKVTTEFEVEPLPKDRLLAFYESVGTAELDGRTFEITRSLSGTGFGLYEEVDGLTVVHTFSINAVIQAALEAIIAESNAEYTQCEGCGTDIIVGEDCPNYGSGVEHA